MSSVKFKLTLASQLLVRQPSPLQSGLITEETGLHVCERSGFGFRFSTGLWMCTDKTRCVQVNSINMLGAKS